MKITVDQLNRKIHENWYYAKSMKIGTLYYAKSLKIGIIIKILMKPSSILFVEASVSLAVVLCTCRVLPESVRKVSPGLE